MGRLDKRSAWLVAALASFQPAAFAAHPLQTEDTGTQGVGNIEIENALRWAHDDDTRNFLYQPQISYGVLPTLDLIVQPSVQHGRDGGDGKYSGFGDTNLDAKWRFFGSAPWSLGFRSGLQLATSSGTPGLPHGTVAAHELLVLTLDEAPITVYGNVGLVQNPVGSDQRRQLLGASAAILWTLNEQLIVTAELAAGSDPEPHRTDLPATYLAGLIWTIVPGLDTDLGYQIGIQRSATRVLLAGFTYRFSY